LTDAEWQIVELTLLLEKQRGKHREVDFWQVVNAIFYRADNGIKWRAMPINLPAWQTVYGYDRKWVENGLWESINALLVEQVQTQAGRTEQSSLGMIDSQSVKQAQKGQLEQGLMSINRCGMHRRVPAGSDLRLFLRRSKDASAIWLWMYWDY